MPSMIPSTMTMYQSSKAGEARLGSRVELGASFSTHELDVWTLKNGAQSDVDGIAGPGF